ncbi:MAG: DUF261 domain-containing protein [Treponema sp.]|nr:DUF261 domain-containing protein [Treponema sp.]
MIKCLIPVLKLLLELLIKKIKSRASTDEHTKETTASTMREGIQTNFPHEVLRRFGCYFFVLMKWLEVKNGMRFSDDDLLRIFERAAVKGLINGADAFVRNAPALLNLGLGSSTYADVRRDLRYPPADGTAIRRLVRGGYGETHFTMQINGVEWDTLDPARAAAKTWSFDSFRVPVEKK